MTPAEHYVLIQMFKHPTNAFNNAVKLVKEYLDTAYHGYYYESKNLRLQTWNPTTLSIQEIVLAIWTICLKETVTFPMICGMLEKRILLDTISSIKIIAEVITLCADSDLIEIEMNGPQTIMWAEQNISNIPELEKRWVHTEPIEYSENYDETMGHLILGSKLNRHDEKICLDIMNQQNRIQFSLNTQLLSTLNQPINPEHKKEDIRFHRYCYNTYLGVINDGNRFTIPTKVDTRGRLYCTGYALNYQGMKYQKAVIELTNKELVKMEV